jgi:hypothetical protein
MLYVAVSSVSLQVQPEPRSLQRCSLAVALPAQKMRVIERMIRRRSEFRLIFTCVSLVHPAEAPRSVIGQPKAAGALLGRQDNRTSLLRFT